MENIFTIDVEDWFHTYYYADKLSEPDWDGLERTVEGNTEKILAVLDDAGVSATFFVLGWIVDKHPSLVKSIHAAGHDVATHGYSHRLLYHISPEEFRDDLRRCIDITANITGKHPAGFRAPCFSVTAESLWALDILYEEGFSYDASILPMARSYCGIPGAEKYPYVHKSAGDRSLVEFPVSTTTFFGRTLPFCGGAYMRLLPYSVVKSRVEALNAAGQPAIVYIHPWEIDLHTPKESVSPLVHLKYGFSHNLRLKTTLPKVKSLLSDFNFTSFSKVIAKYSS